MLESYLPILVLVAIAFAFAVGSVVMSRLVGMKKPTAVKLAPYECGMPPVGTARERVSVKFYIVAMLFILFDIEAVFLYPPLGYDFTRSGRAVPFRLGGSRSDRRAPGLPFL
jgi:NADH-quinone oxidoreductase subunit A